MYGCKNKSLHLHLHVHLLTLLAVELAFSNIDLKWTWRGKHTEVYSYHYCLKWKDWSCHDWFQNFVDVSFLFKFSIICLPPPIFDILGWAWICIFCLLNVYELNTIFLGLFFAKQSCAYELNKKFLELNLVFNIIMNKHSEFKKLITNHSVKRKHLYINSQYSAV